MKDWQLVLEEFAVSKEPQTWELPRVRMSPLAKFEAVQFLLEKDFIRVAGRQRDLHTDNLYEATLTGKFCWQAGFCMIQRRDMGPGSAKVADMSESLAQRTHAIAANSVFDLARAPWVWEKKPGSDRP